MNEMAADICDEIAIERTRGMHTYEAKWNALFVLCMLPKALANVQARSVTR